MLCSKVRERERDRHLEKMHHRKPLQFCCSKQTYSPNSQKSAKKIHTIICKKKVSRIIGIISVITLSSKQTRKHASVFLSVSLSHHYCWQLPSYVKTPSWLLWAHFYGPRLVSDVCFWPLFRTLSTDFRKVLKRVHSFSLGLRQLFFPLLEKTSFLLSRIIVCLFVCCCCYYLRCCDFHEERLPLQILTRREWGWWLRRQQHEDSAWWSRKLNIKIRVWSSRWRRSQCPCK